MSKRSYPFPYKTVANDLTLEVSQLSIGNITIQSPNTYPTYTLTLPPDDGAPGQILSTDGSGVLSWINDSTGGTVTSVSASVPSWLSVTVTNATTTPLIAITGTATGTGITVLQDSPTINTLLTVSGQLDIPRNSGSGHAIKITNAHAGVQDNYIEVGKNSSNRNHAHFGHHFEASGDAGNYAFIQTNSNFIKFAGTADFTFPATASANNGNLLFSTTAGVTSWSNTFNNGMTGYIFNSPVDFNAQVLINTNLILNSTLQVNGDLLVNQNTANGRLAYFYNDSVHENVGNQIYVGQDLSDSVQLGHYYATNLADRYAYLQTNNTKMIFTGEAAWKFPTTLGTSGQSLITNGAGVTSWADRVSAVSATVPSFMSVTVTNPNTTPAIAISAPSTGSGNVVLATSPTMSTPIIENFGTVSALIGQNAAATIVVRALTDVYITKYKSGATGVLNNAFMITTNPANPSNTFFYTQGSSVGIFSQAPQETLDVQGSIRASNFIRFNNVSVYPGSSGVTSLYLPTSPGTNGQVLTSTGSGTAMTWTTPTTGTVTSVTATSPIVSSGGATPDISLSTVPTTLGGTGLTTVGTNGQVLTSNGTSLTWTTPTTGTVTSVSATSPLTSSGGATPTISLSTIPTTLGGTGLTTVGTNGQVLTSNGTSLTWTTPTTGTVTSVSATSPLTSSGGATPTISIASSTGTGGVALQTAPTFLNTVSVTNPTQAAVTLLSGTSGVGSAANISDLNLNTVGLGGGIVSQYIRAAYSPSNGYYISVNPGNDFLSNATRSLFPNIVSIGGDVGTSKLNIGDGAMDPALYGTVQITQTDVTNTKASISFVRNGNYVYGLGYLSGSSTFGFGQGVITGFTPDFLSILPTGNIGIGTATPAQKLHVVANNPNATMILENTSSSGFAVAQFKTTTQLCNIGVGGPSSGVNDAFYIFFGAAVRFLMDVSGNVTLGAALSVSGNLGIGTTSPTQKLHVVDSGTADTVSIQNTNASGYASISFDTTTQDFTLGVGGPTATAFSGALQNKIYFYYNTDVRVVIDTSGNFGIGTTSPSTKLQVNGTTRSTNFTTNGTNTFTYASGTFTPRIAMFYTSDGKVYECNNAPAGKDNMGITYSVQTGLWVRVGNLVTVNMEIQYSQTYAGITFDLTNLNIVAVIPEAACNPSTLGAVGMTGYPSRIADRFEDNFQMNYWISNTSYAPGGTICEVQLRRNNTHNMMPWDPTSKSGQRLNITTSYYVNQ